MGVFDEIQLVLNGIPLLTIARGGPLESGSLNPQGVWQPVGLPQQLFIDGFGINASGEPFYDASSSEAQKLGAALWIDPVAHTIQLKRDPFVITWPGNTITLYSGPLLLEPTTFLGPTAYLAS